MTLVFAIGMGALALSPFVAVRLGRAAALLSAGGCVLLVIVGMSAALGGANPVLNLGGSLGFGHSALRADGLAGIFLALTAAGIRQMILRSIPHELYAAVASGIQRGCGTEGHAERKCLLGGSLGIPVKPNAESGINPNGIPG